MAGFRFHPNLPTVTIYYTTADGQSNTCSGFVLLIVQPFEYFKDLLEMLRVNANTVVADGKDPVLPAAFG